MSNSDEIIFLYEKYGFELEDNQNPEKYLVFSYRKGYFQNAEILLIDLDFDFHNLEAEYKASGFAVKINKYSSLDEIHSQLFSGFFLPPNNCKKLRQEYECYARKQTEKIGFCEYKFIPCRFVDDNNESRRNLIEYIYQRLFENGPQLIIVEAAAGFGKTSISYELIKELSADSKGTVPIITELSKNRTASIFKYVLLTEIDSKFSNLSSELVTYEIKQGKVPLIIDGFDELLSKSHDDVPSDLSDSDEKTAQTMLSTIAQLLDENSHAKIVLTSRKSSIFAGELFEEWSDKHLPHCQITRIQIIPPVVSDWLDESKIKLLRSRGIVFDDISNPTLLTFLSSQSNEDIASKFTSVDSILQQYFKILLKREQERQSLTLKVDEQLSLMESVAGTMASFKQSTCTSSEIKDIIRMSLGENILEYLDRYSDFSKEDVPTEDEFLQKLSHHALLDRIPNTSNSIGFINDFIFGYLIAEAITIHQFLDLSPTEIEEKYWNLMVTSYGICSQKKRDALYRIITDNKIEFTPYEELHTDLALLHKTSHEYVRCYYESVYFGENVSLTSSNFKDCVFSCCTFNSCSISSDAFEDCKFYGCHFYEVEIVPANNQKNCNLIFSNCCGESELRKISCREPILPSVNTETEYEKKVLEQYWRPGSDRADRRRLFSTLFKGYSQQDYDGISEAIDRLYGKDILLHKRNCIELNFEKMSEIREILGR